MDDVVVAKVFLDIRDIYRVTFKIDLKGLSLLIEEIPKIYAFPI